jgi:mono/diheme cytochrome c family protein
MQVFGPVARRALTLTLFGAWFALVLSSVQTSGRQQALARPSTPASPRPVFDQYCITCHNQKLHTAGLALDTLDITNPSANAEVWEKVIAKLRQGTMPPLGRPRPDAATYRATASWLETEIDRAWATHPSPGRIGAVHRLNRSEYNNAIRDLFALDLDVKPLLPGDETADGSFDNFASSLSISPAHLERYLSVAQQVTRLAVGLPPERPVVEIFDIPLHVLQDDQQSEDLPLGSRGGIAVRHVFPVGGEYTIRVRLQRQYQDYLKGMGWPQQLDIRLDGKLLKRFSVGGNAPGRPAASSYAGDGEPNFAGAPEWEEYMLVTGDKGLEVRTQVEAGPHVVGASFVREMWEPEGLPQPQQRARVITNDQVYMDFANVHSVQIGGPYQTAGPAKDTPSRRTIFVCEPKVAAEERACATTILSRMARLAYRRPVTSGGTAGALTPGFNSRSNGCSSIPISCCACIGIPRRRRRETPRITWAIWTSPRVCRSSCGAAFPTRACSAWPSAVS